MTQQKTSYYYLNLMQSSEQTKKSYEDLISNANNQITAIQNDIAALETFKTNITSSKTVIENLINDFNTISNYLQFVIIKGYPFDQDGQDKEGEFQRRKKLLADANSNLQSLLTNIETQLSGLRSQQTSLELNIKTYNAEINTAATAYSSAQSSYNQAVLQEQMAQSKPKPSRSCFQKGTKVFTKDGLIDIDKINVGDLVLSYNIETKSNEYKEVEKTIIHENEESDLYTLYFDNYKLNVTGDHRFYINGDWVEARSLKINDNLYYQDGKYIKIDNIKFIKFTDNYYNIEVKDNHNYYVSDRGVLVHNTKEKIQ